MKKKSKETPNWLLIGLGFASLFAGLISSLFQQPVVVYYTLLTLAVALLIAAKVDLRMDTIERKLDELLDSDRKSDERKQSPGASPNFA